MKKYLSKLLGIFILLVINPLYASLGSCSFLDGTLIEFRTSFFYPSSSDLRKVFGNAKVNYQITGTIPFYPNTCCWMRGIDLWLAVDYLSCHGRSIPLHDKTSLRIVPLTLGLKYFFPCVHLGRPLNFYGGTGMKYYYVHTHNHSDFVKETVDKNGLGGVFEIGFFTPIVDGVILDFFTSYSIKYLGESSSSSSYPAVKMVGMDASGFNLGLGLGYLF